MPESRHDIVPAIEAFEVREGLRLWWLGGPSYVIKSPTTTVYVDPYHCGDRAGDPRGFERAIANYFLPEDVTRADAIISTHNHSDHCDPATLEPMCRQTAARIVAAPSSAEKLAPWAWSHGRVDVFARGTSGTYGDITLTAFQARDWDDPAAVTFVLGHAGRQVFVGGDTLFFPGLAEIGARYALDLAVLSLARNRRDLIDAELYLDPPALARAALTLKAATVLPVHWDIWKAWVEDPRLVEPYLSGTGTRFALLDPGQSLALG